MHTRFEALVIGDALKQLCEGPALSIVQSGGELVLVVQAELTDLAQHLRACIREAQGMVAAVGGAAPALQYTNRGDPCRPP